MNRRREPAQAPADFDSAWYAQQFPDVAISGLDPLEHYVRYGALLGRAPGPAAAPARQSGAARTETARASAPPSSAYSRMLEAHLSRCADTAAKDYIRGDELDIVQLPGRASNTLVSIIMPTRDRAYVIGNAIESVMDQTHSHWELLVCDDGSNDQTTGIVSAFTDSRIKYASLPARGAAQARNYGLQQARGEVIAYLDSDNLWHPRYLEIILGHFDMGLGCSAVNTNYLALALADDVQVMRCRPVPYSYERLASANFIDLSAFSHRRSLYERLGGFSEDLPRLQDWDLVLKYLFHRDPVSIDHSLMLYRSNRAWGQISHRHASDRRCEESIAEAVKSYYSPHAPTHSRTVPASLTVLSWDVSRNHFSKAYNICEAVSAQQEVELVGFRFFEDAIFPPYANARPRFPMKILSGGTFPEWGDQLDQALEAIAGDVVYAVKPRLPSLGLALLANYYKGRPFILEMNDLESVVAAPQRGDRAKALNLNDIDPATPELRNPQSRLWSQLLEGLIAGIPLKATHNRALDDYFGGGAFFVRNPKDESHFDPGLYDRSETRQSLGYQEGDQVVLFSGLLREHKGVLQLAELVRDGNDRRHLLFVASRHSFEVEQVRQIGHPGIKVLEAMDRNEIARITAAADAVVLWLDPEFAASRYQMPFKLTDALAMKVPVLANDIGDLELLGKQGYLRTVPFGDMNRLAQALDLLRQDKNGTGAMTEAGRLLYLRQFSYAATRRNVAMAVEAARNSTAPCIAAERFAEFFSRFRRTSA